MKVISCFLILFQSILAAELHQVWNHVTIEPGEFMLFNRSHTFLQNESENRRSSLVCGFRLLVMNEMRDLEEAQYDVFILRSQADLDCYLAAQKNTSTSCEFLKDGNNSILDVKQLAVRYSDQYLLNQENEVYFIVIDNSQFPYYENNSNQTLKLEIHILTDLNLSKSAFQFTLYGVILVASLSLLVIPFAIYVKCQEKSLPSLSFQMRRNNQNHGYTSDTYDRGSDDLSLTVSSSGTNDQNIINCMTANVKQVAIDLKPRKAPKMEQQIKVKAVLQNSVNYEKLISTLKKNIKREKDPKLKLSTLTPKHQRQSSIFGQSVKAVPVSTKSKKKNMNQDLFDVFDDCEKAHIEKTRTKLQPKFPMTQTIGYLDLTKLDTGLSNKGQSLSQRERKLDTIVQRPRVSLQASLITRCGSPSVCTTITSFMD